MISVVDFILLIVCLFFVLRGLFRGILMEIFSVLALVAGFLASINFYPLATGWFESIFPAGASRNAAGMAAVFIAVWLLIKILSWVLNRNLGEAANNPASRITGGALALAKAVLFLSLVVYLAESVWPNNKITMGNRSTEISYQVVETLKSFGFFPDLPDRGKETSSGNKTKEESAASDPGSGAFFTTKRSPRPIKASYRAPVGHSRWPDPFPSPAIRLPVLCHGCRPAVPS